MTNSKDFPGSEGKPSGGREAGPAADGELQGPAFFCPHGDDDYELVKRARNMACVVVNMARGQHGAACRTLTGELAFIFGQLEGCKAKVKNLEDELGVWQTILASERENHERVGAMLDAARASLARIRDRYVKSLPGKDKPVCTLCGAEEGTPHDREKNCGWAEDALEARDED